jgi:hypothetical protein
MPVYEVRVEEIVTRYEVTGTLFVEADSEQAAHDAVEAAYIAGSDAFCSCVEWDGDSHPDYTKFDGIYVEPVDWPASCRVVDGELVEIEKQP